MRLQNQFHIVFSSHSKAGFEENWRHYESIGTNKTNPTSLSGLNALTLECISLLEGATLAFLLLMNLSVRQSMTWLMCASHRRTG